MKPDSWHHRLPWLRRPAPEWQRQWLKLGIRVHRTAVVDAGARIGKGSIIWHFTHIRSSAVIGDNCTIGQCCYVDANVQIGRDCKIANGVQIYQGVSIGHGVFVGPNTTFTNDLYPRAVDGSGQKINFTNFSSTKIEDGASIGAGCVILPVVIGAGSLIAAGTIVAKDVKPRQLIRCQQSLVMSSVDLRINAAAASCRPGTGEQPSP